MFLVSQFHFVYWYNIVLVVLTRSTSSVNVECMLNGKQEFTECTVGRQTAVYTRQVFPPA